MEPYLSIIIPAYNEERRIESSLKAACDYLVNHHYEYEIIVVDDGSTDRTVEIAENFKDHVTVIRQPQNKGKGAAVRTGMLEAKGQLRIFTDADFSTPIYEIDKLIEQMENGNDVCIGSRAINPELIKKHQPFLRELMGKAFNLFVRILLMGGIKDTQCGFKGFNAKAAQDVFSKAKIDGFGFDVEILFLSKQLGYSISQVPVEWYNDERTRVSTSKGIKAFLELFEIRRLHK